ncbi:hypothetical protein BH09ACT7_BH09ACT7_36810 [soil metagenome]
MSDSGKVEVTDSAKEEAKEMAKAYEDRPTVVLPGSDGTVAGTAVGDWLDDDGNPKYSEDSKTSDESSR